MSQFDEIFERIKLATHTRTQIELAKVLDIRQSSISDAKRRNSVPSYWCMRLFECFGLNPDWIKKGTGPMYLRTETGYAPVEVDAALAGGNGGALYGDPNANSRITSVFSMQALGDNAQEPAVVGKLSVPLSFSGPGIRVFLLDSASMEPLMCKGAYIGVDTTRKQIVSGELYAVNLPHEGLAVKRIFPNSMGDRFFLRVENPQHPERTMPAVKLGESILGRVAWVVNKY